MEFQTSHSTTIKSFEKSVFSWKQRCNSRVWQPYTESIEFSEQIHISFRKIWSKSSNHTSSWKFNYEFEHKAAKIVNFSKIELFRSFVLNWFPTDYDVDVFFIQNSFEANATNISDRFSWMCPSIFSSIRRWFLWQFHWHVFSSTTIWYSSAYRLPKKIQSQVFFSTE